MRLLIQRVTKASVCVDEHTISSIKNGMLVLVGFGNNDTAQQVDRMLKRLFAYRLFADEQGKTNRDLVQSGGALLLVPQFTLYADTGRGLRPGYSQAAPAKLANALFGYAIEKAKDLAQQVGVDVQSGIFGANMQVSLINDGPFTLMLDSDEGRSPLPAQNAASQRVQE